MQGFDDGFRDLPDYIEKITREIWEERGIGQALERYYARDIIVRAPPGLTTSNAGVTAATLGTLHEFPDRRLIYEDVIWSGNAFDGFVSSHRLISVMRKQNDGPHGPASGALVRSRVIADCVCKANQITEEWLIRDYASFAYCLGTSPRALARTLAEQDLQRTGTVQFFTPEMDIAGPYVAHIDDSAEAQLYRGGWQTIWGAKTPAAIRDHYALGAAVFVPGGEALNGPEDYDRFVISYLAAFPDAEFSVEHLIVNRDPGQPIRIAMRWSIRATHSGWGRFGEPSGAPIYIMGINHAHVVDGRITMEWVQIDEVTLWKQIFAYALLAPAMLL